MIACPRCNVRTKVSDCRVRPDGTIRRRRKCPRCGEKFTTRESIWRGLDFVDANVKDAVKELLNGALTQILDERDARGGANG